MVEKLLSGTLKIADPPPSICSKGWGCSWDMDSWLSFGLCWCWARKTNMSDVCQSYRHFNNPAPLLLHQEPLLATLSFVVCRPGRFSHLLETPQLIPSVVNTVSV